MERFRDAVFVAVGLAGVAAWWAHEDGAQEAQRQVEMQCEMYELHQKTNGDQGWPNYEGVECEKD